ncbi:MAG: RagB/SusD family nutrient uptake outer membrane protein, partial [Bacteroidota bacterium]
MKNHISIQLLIFMLAWVCSGCSEFLEVKPASVWESENFYSNPEEAGIALAGIYGVLANDFGYGRDLTIILEAGTDEMYYNRRANENWGVALYRNTPSDNETFQLWTNHYEAINLANLFLESIDPSTFDSEGDFNALVGEARFLRALCYFNLSNLWEAIPLRLESSKNQDANNLEAAPLSEIYQAIIDDLTFAAQNLPHPSDPAFIPGRVHKLAAHGILARVYLKMSGAPFNENHYQDALNHCDSVILDGFHQLTTTEDTLGYRQVFLDIIGGPYNTSEVLFEISFQNLRDQGITNVEGRHGNLNGLNFGSSATFGLPNGFAQAGVYPNLANLFDKQNDKRYAWNIASYKRNGSGDILAVTNELAVRDFCPAKLRRWEPLNYEDLNISSDNEQYVELENSSSQLNRNFTSVNFPVLRYSDVLLMYAEAANELAGAPTPEAIQYLNEVRNRAGLANIEEVSPGVVANQQSFFNELVDERSRELCFEGLRRFDLIRWGLLGEKLQEVKLIVEGHPNFSSTNEDHLSILRPPNNFDESKHLSLPYP